MLSSSIFAGLKIIISFLLWTNQKKTGPDFLQDPALYYLLLSFTHLITYSAGGLAR